MLDKIKRDPKELKNGEKFIYNTGNHWIGLFKKKGKLYEFDSFGRDMLGDQFIDSNKKEIQKMDESNCGQRTINKLSKLR